MLRRLKLDGRSAESERAAREETNCHQPLCKLPPEIRLLIFEQLAVAGYGLQEMDGTPLREIPRYYLQDKPYCQEHRGSYRYGQHWRWYMNHIDFVFPARFPALMRVCRLIRTEYIPILFANVRVSLDLSSIPGLSKKELRNELRWAEKLCKVSIASIGRIELLSQSTCRDTVHRHTTNAGGVGRYLLHVIDRQNGDIRSDYVTNMVRSDRIPKGSPVPYRCCQEAADREGRWFKNKVQELGLHDKEHVLCAHDFKKLRADLAARPYKEATY